MTDELRLPCRESDTPDDWFIGSDGRQYPSDDLLTPEQIEEAVASTGKTLADEDYEDAAERAIARAQVDARTAALQARRHAKQACLDCAFRTRCLDMALRGGETHGTWGGYYEEEIAVLQAEIARRRRERAEALLALN